jgi:anti-sigma B factor antagonist
MNIEESTEHALEDWKVLLVKENRLDAYIAAEFKAALLHAIEDGTRRLMLDIHQVEFMDSSGLGAIVHCLQRIAQEGQIAIARAQEPVALMLRLTNIDKVLTLVERPEDVLQQST